MDTFSKLHHDYFWPALPPLSHLHNKSFSQILNQCHSLRSIDDFNLFAIRWWFIWYFKNQVVFNEESSPHSVAASVMNNFTKNWLKTSSEMHNYLPSSNGSTPNSAKLPRKKKNFDGSKIKCGKASCGFVLRDERRTVWLELRLLVMHLRSFKRRLRVLEKALGPL